MRRLAGVALVLGVIVAPMWPARASTQEVDIQDTQYVPAELTITPGETVVWRYSGSDFHSVTADDGSFDSSPTCVAPVNCMSNGNSFPHTFFSTGTFTYHCKVHAMTGTIVVTAASTTTSTTTTSTTLASTTSTSDTSTTLSSDQPTVTQGSLPSLPQASPVALPKAIVSARHVDDLRPLVFADVAIAGGTIAVGIMLVRRGRIPFG